MEEEGEQDDIERETVALLREKDRQKKGLKAGERKKKMKWSAKMKRREGGETSDEASPLLLAEKFLEGQAGNKNVSKRVIEEAETN